MRWNLFWLRILVFATLWIFHDFFIHTTIVKNVKKCIRKFRFLLHTYIQIRMLLKKKLHPILHVIFRVQNEYLTKGQKGTKSREENGKTIIFIWIFGSCLVWSLWKLYCNVNCIASRYCKNKANPGQKPTSQINFRWIHVKCQLDILSFAHLYTGVFYMSIAEVIFFPVRILLTFFHNFAILPVLLGHKSCKLRELFWYMTFDFSHYERPGIRGRHNNTFSGRRINNSMRGSFQLYLFLHFSWFEEMVE